MNLRQGRDFLSKGLIMVLAGMALSYTAAMAGDLPDSTMTPGWINPDVTLETIHETICVPGYTDTIRPNITKLKREQIIAYGFADIQWVITKRII